MAANQPGATTMPKLSKPTSECNTQIRADVIPDDLKERDQWVLWRYITKDNGRVTKEPFQRTGKHASSTDPLTWTSFDAAVEAYTRGGFSGIGFVFSPDDPFCGIDLDDCLVNGELKPWAQRFAARFCDTYMEVSPSGNGIKIFCRGTLPGRGHKREHKDGAIEIYDQGRFFAVTAMAWRGSLAEIEDHQSDVQHVHTWAAAITSSKQKYNLKDFPKITPKQKDGDPSQHDFLKTQAARLRNLGMQFPVLLTTLKVINQEHCNPLKPHKEVEDLARYFSGRESWAELIESQTEPAAARAEVIEMRKPAAVASTSIETIDWRERLLRKKPTLAQQAKGERGAALAELANVVIALTYAPEWQDVFAFDEFALEIVNVKETPFGKPPGRWLDPHTSRTTCWLQHNGIHVNSKTTGEGIQTVALDRRFHPVRDYLNGLKHDGTKRLHNWAAKYLGATGTIPCMFAQMWMVSAVARIMNPGVKVDTCLILEGGQGERKSTALANLVPNKAWFTDRISDFGTKDSLQECNGVWIIEIAEFDAHIRGRDAGKVKSFMSSPTNRFRLPYGHMVEEFPRQCVFAGSTNRTDYLQDETGGRRFWPIQCGSIDAEGLLVVRDQLWAEAVHEFKQGTPWWITDSMVADESRNEQAMRYEPGPWDDKIAEYLLGKDDVSVSEILEHAIGKKPHDWSQRDSNAVAKALRHWKWEQKRVGKAGIRRYVRTEETC